MAKWTVDPPRISRNCSNRAGSDCRRRRCARLSNRAWIAPSHQKRNPPAGANTGRRQDATTENPDSASLQASVPPPAPVPTITKSTSSFAPNSRIGTQAPSRKTSGARPCNARGVRIGSSLARLFSRASPSDTKILPASFFFVARLRLGSLPPITPIEVHSDITPRTCRPAPTNLVPACRMRIVSPHHVRERTLVEKDVAWHAIPCRAVQLAAFRGVQQLILVRLCEFMEFCAVAVMRFGIQALPTRAAMPRCMFGKRASR